MQNTFENSSVRDFRECNRILEYATSSSTRGFYISADSSWDDVVVTISEASFCQEQCQSKESLRTSNHKKLDLHHGTGTP